MALLSNVWGFDRMKLLKSVPVRPEVSKGRAEVPKPVGGRARALRYLGERMGGERLFFQTCRGFDPMKLLPVRPEVSKGRAEAPKPVGGRARVLRYLRTKSWVVNRSSFSRAANLCGSDHQPHVPTRRGSN